MSLRETVLGELGTLDEHQLSQVADYVSFLKLRSHRSPGPSDAELAELYAEGAEEDHTLAEAGMDDYATGLAREDEAR